MKTEIAKSSPEPLVWAVARPHQAAERLAQRLRADELEARPGGDLEEVLASRPAVLVIDPGGWEGPCRRSLAGYDSRPDPPPGVLFTGEDRLVVHTAGPAFGFIPPLSGPGAFAAAVRQALEARGRFVHRWPLPPESGTAAERLRIAGILESAAGTDVRPDRQGAFADALRTRMVARLIPTLSEYAAFLEDRGGRSAEVEALAGLLCVGETHFWRYADQFEALQGVLIPSLLRRRGGRPRRLRLWSAGCATGEEVYSLAMACLEALGPRAEVEVIGTELFRPFLARAEAGVYGARALRCLPRHLRERYLEPAPGGARAGPSLKSRAKFEFLNLKGEDARRWAEQRGPFDAIFCRNTLIYFSRAAAGQAVELFASALVDEGGLFLGASEAVHVRHPSLVPVRGRSGFFRRKARAVPPRSPSKPAGRPEDRDEVRVAQLYEAGLARMEEDDREGARERFSQILALRPADARGHAGLALVLCSEGREAEAARRLGRAVEDGPELAETWYLLGLLAERRGDDAGALEHYRQALDVVPGFFMAYVNRGWILRRMGRREEFAREMRAGLAVLEERPKIPGWVTAGLGWEAVRALVAEALMLETGEA